jgi:hypothetical protein
MLRLNAVKASSAIGARVDQPSLAFLTERADVSLERGRVDGLVDMLRRPVAAETGNDSDANDYQYQERKQSIGNHCESALDKSPEEHKARLFAVRLRRRPSVPR